MLLDTFIYRLSSFLAGLSSIQPQPQHNAMTSDSIQPQSPLEAPFVVPPPATPLPDFTAENGPLLSDLLTIENSLSIFYSYARETTAGRLFETEGAGVTVFAPTNKAVMALPRKPHQDANPVEEGTVISEKEFDTISKQNVERWISAHIVPQHPIRLVPTSQFEALLEGVVITVGEPNLAVQADDPEWKHVILNGNITVLKRVEAANGALYFIDGAIYGN